MSQLANEVGCTSPEIESALDQMDHMGYIHRQQFGPQCSSSCATDGCEGCGFASSESFAVWVLTERGQAIVSSETK